jgi:hypothetical protein
MVPPPRHRWTSGTAHAVDDLKCQQGRRVPGRREPACRVPTPPRRVAAGAGLLPGQRRQRCLLRDRDAGEAVARPVRLWREIVWSDGADTTASARRRSSSG